MFDINSLAVINVDARHLPTEVASWNYYNVIFLDTCTRKCWVGQKSDFQDFPVLHLPEEKSQYLVGQEAYEFLLRLKSGLISPKLGETNIDGQFIRDHQAFGQRCPGKYEEMSKFMETLKADARYIRSNYIEQLQKGTMENAAKLLANFKRGDKVLIVGKTGRNNASVSQVTLDVAFAVSHASQISYTCPDALALDVIEARFKEEDVAKRFSSATKLNKVSLADIRPLIENGCHVFIDQPMGESSWNDSFLMGSWKAAQKNGFSMVHLRGSPSLMGGSTKAWKGAELSNYFGPEDVRDRKIKADHDNQVLIAQANYDVSVLAAARLNRSTAHAFKIIKEHPAEAAGQQKLDFC